MNEAYLVGYWKLLMISSSAVTHWCFDSWKRHAGFARSLSECDNLAGTAKTTIAGRLMLVSLALG